MKDSNFEKDRRWEEVKVLACGLPLEVLCTEDSIKAWD